MLAGLDGEAEPVERPLGRARIAEADVAELDLALDSRLSFSASPSGPSGGICIISLIWR